jgi:Domain of unknown function (DUF4395)
MAETSILRLNTRQRLVMQGFACVDDETLLAIRPWLRLGPAICGAWTMAALIWRSAPGLWALVPFAALGGLFPVQPFDLPYNLVIRHWTGTPAIPRYGAAKRFACFLAAAWISATALLLDTGAAPVAIAFGTVPVISTMLYVTGDFCMGAWLYQRSRQAIEMSSNPVWGKLRRLWQ